MSRPANNPEFPGSVYPLAIDDISNADKELADAVMAVQRSLLGGGAAGTGLSNMTYGGTVTASQLTSTGGVNAGGNVVGNQGVFSAGIRSGNGTVASANRIWEGTGAPGAGLGADGDFYFRNDTPGTANQRIYVRSAGAWVGIV